MGSRISNTIRYLLQCQLIRKQGHPVSYTTDPSWLVNVAVNRRAGWPDDPTHSRGSCRPVRRHGILIYPPKARGDEQRHLWLLAHKINTPRLIVRPAELGEWRKLLLSRIPNRFYEED